jgi:hypothetical protein
MAISIISRPQGLCLSGNIPKLVLESIEDVRIRLYLGSKTVLDEIYSPDFEHRIRLDISDIVINELYFTMPGSDIFIQPNVFSIMQGI